MRVASPHSSDACAVMHRADLKKAKRRDEEGAKETARLDSCIAELEMKNDRTQHHLKVCA